MTEKVDPIPGIQEPKSVFTGKRISVFSGFSKTKTGKVTRELVVHPGAVVLLPFLGDSDVILIRNDRFAVEQRLWELPAGTLEPDEEPKITAARELIEETGYQAGKITPLFDFYTTPGFSNERMYAFVAEDLNFVGQQLEESENIAVEIVSWEKALEMVKNRTICDGKTIATLLYYNQFRS